MHEKLREACKVIDDAFTTGEVLWDDSVRRELLLRVFEWSRELNSYAAEHIPMKRD